MEAMRVRRTIGELQRSEHDDLIAQFDEYLQIKGVSPQTRNRYRCCLRGLFRDLKLPVDHIGQVNPAQLRTHITALQARHLADSTVAAQVTMIKSFFRFVVEEGYLQTNPADRIPSPKVAQRLPRARSPEQVRAFFAVIAKGKLERDRWNLVLFHLCYVCGLRIREAASVQCQHLDLAAASLRVIGKGDKERLLFLRPKTVELLKEHIARTGASDFLFPGDEDGHVSLSDLRIEFQSYAADASLPEPITAHVLRHSIAVHYLMGGAPISFVQRLLGHANLATTGIYTRLTDAIAKDIALKTPTAMDRTAEPEKPGRLEKLKEAQKQYVVAVPHWEQWVRVALGVTDKSRTPRGHGKRRQSDQSLPNITQIIPLQIGRVDLEVG